MLDNLQQNNIFAKTAPKKSISEKKLVANKYFQKIQDQTTNITKMVCEIFQPNQHRYIILKTRTFYLTLTPATAKRIIGLTQINKLTC